MHFSSELKKMANGLLKRFSSKTVVIYSEDYILQLIYQDLQFLPRSLGALTKAYYLCAQGSDSKVGAFVRPGITFKHYFLHIFCSTVVVYIHQSIFPRHL